METYSGSALERAVDVGSRAMARRLTRRSALAGVGKGAVALSLGAAGTALYRSEQARAHTPPGCSGSSVTCFKLTGTNGCPAGTCACGYWVVRDCTRCSGSPNCFKR